MTDGRRLRGQRRRDELVAAALRVLARDGVAGVSHRAVAAEAGVAKSAVGYHFADLDALLGAVLAHQGRVLTAALPDVPAGTDLAWLADLLCAELDHDRGRVVAGYELSLHAARRPALRGAAHVWVDALTAVLRASSDDPDRVRAAVAVVDGWVVQLLATGAEADPRELERLLRVVLR
ncbi:TetR family transcriptional regulator [Rhodococcus aerolatus]